MAVDGADRRLERAARRWTGDRRPARQLREHYTLERALAARLASAASERRGELYREVYDELFSRIAHHPQLGRRHTAERTRQVERELWLLRPLLAERLTFLELGAGDRALTRRVAAHVGESHAVDVASEIADAGAEPANLHVHLTDGRRLPLPDRSIDLAYSNQLMEHLHPDDAGVQLREIARVLRPGGAYLVITPNRLTGPWDVSRLFSTTPTGLHLREYSNRELREQLLRAGFERIRAWTPTGTAPRALPVALFTGPELLLTGLPPRARRAILREPWRKPLNSVRLLAHMPR